MYQFTLLIHSKHAIYALLSELQSQLYTLQAVTQLTDFWGPPPVGFPIYHVIFHQSVNHLYNLPFDLIDAQALSEAILTPFWDFP